MSVELTEQQKESEREKARQYAELMGIEYVDPYPAAAPAAPVTEPVDFSTVSDDVLLELINKRTGTVLSNLNDLKPKPTPEEIQAQQKEREDKMLAYGLTAAKFTKDDYDSYLNATANKIAFIRSDVAAQIRVANPELTEEAVEEKVSQYLFEHLDQNDSLRKAREKELLTFAEIKIKNTYPNIVNLSSDYATYEEGINNKATFDRKVQATLPVYTADVTRALESLRSFTVQIPDTKNPQNNVAVELGYDDNDLKEVSDLLLSNGQVLKAVKEGYTIEQLKEISELMLWKKHGPRMISQAAKKYNATQKEGYLAGRKGLTAADSIVVQDENLESSLEGVYKELLASSTAKN